MRKPSWHADQQGVGNTVLLIARLAVPNRKEAQQNAFVGNAVEVVKLWLRSQVVPSLIGVVGPDPQRRIVRFPIRVPTKVLYLPIATNAAVPGRVARRLKTQQRRNGL